MRGIVMFIVAMVVSLSLISNASARIKWVNGYSTRSGQYRSGHFRDTSNDGNPYNNANYLGLND